MERFSDWRARRQLTHARRPRLRDDAKATRRARRNVIAILVVLALVLGGTAVFQVLGVTRDLRDAEQQIEVAAEAIRDGRLAEARSAIGDAEEKLRRANERIRTSPGLAVARSIPLLQNNLDSVRDSAELALIVLHGGGRILGASSGLEAEDGTLQVSLSDGSVRLEDIDRAQAEVDALLVQMSAGMYDRDGLFLLPPVREVRDAVLDEALRRQAELDRLRRGLVILRQVVGADAPRRTLLAIANTAEMRGAGGMMLNYGVLTGDGGVVELSSFGRVDELSVAKPVDPNAVGLQDDFLARWEGFDVTRDWRNATLGGDFTEMAPALLSMYQRATGVPADAVVQVDPAALAAILSVVGPVQVPEIGEVNADNVVDVVLNDAYRLFPGVEERTDVLGDVAEAAFTALVEGQYPSVRDLASALMPSVDGRHLMMYSADPRVQSALEFYESDGGLPDPETTEYMHLTVQNMSGNKLDYYVDTALDVQGQRVPGELGEVTVTVTVTNGAPEGETEPRYIFGPFDSDHVAGVYRSAVSLYLPTGTSLLDASEAGFRRDPAMATEDGRPVVSYWIDLPAGQTHTTELQLQLAPRPAGEPYSIELVPSARVRPTTATVDLDVGSGRRVNGEVVLESGWRLGTEGPESLAGY